MKIGKIENNVPIPQVRSKFNFPWPEMEVGDSILVKAGKSETVDTLKGKIKGSARYFGEKTGRKFRSLIDREERGVRVWRIE
jgi:hypothetical protein